jgi:hypothetical protein
MIVHLNAGSDVRRPWVLQVAFHEAGHAVVGSLYRLVVARASIVADTEILGYVEYTETSQRAAPADVHIATLLAGQDAQDHASCRYGLPFSLNDGTDRVRARSLVAANLGVRDWLDGAVDVAIERARVNVAQAVNHNWAWIERVARTLAVRKTLTGAEIMELRR